MSYANIIFDLDGTITDSRRDIAGAQLWVLEQLGVKGCTAEGIFPHIGKTLQETFALLLPVHMHPLIPDAVKMYSEYYPPRSLLTTQLFPGVKETLAILRAGGKRMAVASTKRGTGISRATDHFGITEWFVQLQGSGDGPFKPDPFILNKIIGDQGWRREETIMVGDTEGDILAGKSAGVGTCGVTYGSRSGDELRQLTPDYLIDSFPELVAVVDGNAGDGAGSREGRS